MSYLRSMFATPESQDDPYPWAATFAGHAWIAFGPWGLIALAWDTWTATLVTGGDYAARVTAIRARLNEQYGLGM